MVCFGFQADPFVTGMAVIIGYSAGAFLTLRGVFIMPGLVALATLYSYLSGYGIYLIVIVATGYVTTGIWGVVAYFFARIIAFIIEQVVEFNDTKAAFDATGIPLTAAEKHFINAYRLHASRFGKTINVDVSDDELDESNWAAVLADLIHKWPQVVQRFTSE